MFFASVLFFNSLGVIVTILDACATCTYINDGIIRNNSYLEAQSDYAIN